MSPFLDTLCPLVLSHGGLLLCFHFSSWDLNRKGLSPLSLLRLFRLPTPIPSLGVNEPPAGSDVPPLVSAINLRSNVTHSAVQQVGRDEIPREKGQGVSLAAGPGQVP